MPGTDAGTCVIASAYPSFKDLYACTPASTRFCVSYSIGTNKDGKSSWCRRLLDTTFSHYMQEDASTSSSSAFIPTASHAAAAAAAAVLLLSPLSAQAVSGGGGISTPLSGQDLSGQDLTKRSFTKAVLRKTNFAGANLRGGLVHVIRRTYAWHCTAIALCAACSCRGLRSEIILWQLSSSCCRP